MFSSLYFTAEYFDLVYFRPETETVGVFFGGGGWPLGVFFADAVLR